MTTGAPLKPPSTCCLLESFLISTSSFFLLHLRPSSLLGKTPAKLLPESNPCHLSSMWAPASHVSFLGPTWLGLWVQPHFLHLSSQAVCGVSVACIPHRVMPHVICWLSPRSINRTRTQAIRVPCTIPISVSKAAESEDKPRSPLLAAPRGRKNCVQPRPCCLPVSLRVSYT